MIRDLVRRHKGKIRRCYTKERTRISNLVEGKILVAWTIEHTGKVSAVRVEQDTLNAPRVGQCLVRTILGWRFPPNQNSNIVEVRYPFKFKP
jgi:TonB family protein